MSCCHPQPLFQGEILTLRIFSSGGIPATGECSPGHISATRECFYPPFTAHDNTRTHAHTHTHTHTHSALQRYGRGYTHTHTHKIARAAYRESVYLCAGAI